MVLAEPAACVVVAGPANSGKTTLLHLLDAALQHHPDQPLAYVVKGSPDATGRYLFYSPDLREPLKSRVKGRWTTHAVETVGQWIDNTRRQLELVLLDFGGKHAIENERMLRRCSHFIVVARRFENPAEEQAKGMRSWEEACRKCGLEPVARIHSLWATGKPGIRETQGVLECRFRSDAGKPGDSTNGVVVEALVRRLLALRRVLPAPPYFDLRLERRWKPSDLRDLGGKLSALREAASSGAAMTLGGGGVPVWAYLAAMHRVLDESPTARITVFDPKVPGAFVDIPLQLDPSQGGFPYECLRVSWTKQGEGGLLDLQVTSEDRFLPMDAAVTLASAPVPKEGSLREAWIGVTGAVPIWLHLAYSRWVRSGGAQRIAVWDANSKSEVVVWERGSQTG